MYSDVEIMYRYCIGLGVDGAKALVHRAQQVVAADRLSEAPPVQPTGVVSGDDTPKTR
jgi:hypothetical protein